MQTERLQLVSACHISKEVFEALYSGELVEPDLILCNDCLMKTCVIGGNEWITYTVYSATFSL